MAYSGCKMFNVDLSLSILTWWLDKCWKLEATFLSHIKPE